MHLMHIVSGMALLCFGAEAMHTADPLLHAVNETEAEGHAKLDLSSAHIGKREAEPQPITSSDYLYIIHPDDDKPRPKKRSKLIAECHAESQPMARHCDETRREGRFSSKACRVLFSKYERCLKKAMLRIPGDVLGKICNGNIEHRHSRCLHNPARPTHCHQNSMERRICVNFRSSRAYSKQIWPSDKLRKNWSLSKKSKRSSTELDERSVDQPGDINININSSQTDNADAPSSTPSPRFPAAAAPANYNVFNVGSSDSKPQTEKNATEESDSTAREKPVAAATAEEIVTKDNATDTTSASENPEVRDILDVMTMMDKMNHKASIQPLEKTWGITPAVGKAKSGKPRKVSKIKSTLTARPKDFGPRQLVDSRLTREQIAHNCIVLFGENGKNFDGWTREVLLMRRDLPKVAMSKKEEIKLLRKMHGRCTLIVRDFLVRLRVEKKQSRRQRKAHFRDYFPRVLAEGTTWRPRGKVFSPLLGSKKPGNGKFVKSSPKKKKNNPGAATRFPKALEPVFKKPVQDDRVRQTCKELFQDRGGYEAGFKRLFEEDRRYARLVKGVEKSRMMSMTIQTCQRAAGDKSAAGSQKRSVNSPDANGIIVNPEPPADLIPDDMSDDMLGKRDEDGGKPWEAMVLDEDESCDEGEPQGCDGEPVSRGVSTGQPRISGKKVVLPKFMRLGWLQNSSKDTEAAIRKYQERISSRARAPGRNLGKHRSLGQMFRERFHPEEKDTIKKPGATDPRKAGDNLGKHRSLGQLFRDRFRPEEKDTVKKPSATDPRKAGNTTYSQEDAKLARHLGILKSIVDLAAELDSKKEVVDEQHATVKAKLEQVRGNAGGKIEDGDEFDDEVEDYEEDEYEDEINRPRIARIMIFPSKSGPAGETGDEGEAVIRRVPTSELGDVIADIIRESVAEGADEDMVGEEVEK